MQKKMMAKQQQSKTLNSHMRLFKTWLFFSTLLLLSANLISTANADENLYQQHYKAQSTYDLRSMQANPDTKLYVSNHKDKDNISMLEKGYDMMGSSGFEAGDVAADLALQHGKAIKADVVLVYSKYGSSRSAGSKIAMIKEAIKNGEELTEADMAEPATIYKYYASYWAKLPMPSLGVHIVKLVAKSTDSERNQQASRGLKILAVIKGSAAEQAGILRGDQLIAINQQALQTPEDLMQAVSQNRGKPVDIQFIRDDVEYHKLVQLN